MDFNKFTWYRSKQKYTREQMIETYNILKILCGTVDLDAFINQVYESGRACGDDSSDGSYSSSWANVR